MRVALSLLASLLLHVIALTLAMPHWLDYREAKVFRARLSYQPRYVPPQSHRIPPEGDTRAELTYLPSQGVAAPIPELASTPQSAAPDSLHVAPPGASPHEIGVRPADGFVIADIETVRPQVTGATPSISDDRDAGTELVRLEDIARSGTDRAAIILNPVSRRSLRGFVHFSEFRIDGMWDTDLTLPGLARYVRHVTDIDARLQGNFVSSFHQPQLQRTPILFLLQGSGEQGQPRMSADEIAALGRYLRSGGFLFIEAALDTLLRPPEIFLRPIINYVRQALAPDGRLIEVPAGHPVYHSYYDFPDGFMGVPSPLEAGNLGATWHYDPPRARSGLGGLWGVELDGELVALVSDLGLHNGWPPTQDAARVASVLQSAGRRLPARNLALHAGVNILVYALTRSKGFTRRLPTPAWAVRRPSTPPGGMSIDGPQHGRADHGAPLPSLDESLYAGLPASLALVHSPIGTEPPEPVRIAIDGLDYGLVEPGFTATLIHGLAPGEHLVTIACGNATKALLVELAPGRTTTVRFRRNRYLFLKTLSARMESARVASGTWLSAFSDLHTAHIDAADMQDRYEGLLLPLGGDP